MPGFATYDQIVNAISVNGLGQRSFFSKTSFASAAALQYDLWLAAGSPPTGAFGTALTGRAIDNTFAAAMRFIDPGGARQMHLMTLGLGSTIALGTALLYDRIVEYPFNGTVTSGTFTQPGVFPTRDNGGTANGNGYLLMVQNFSTTANAAVTFTPTYTNSAGTAGRTAAGVLLVSGISGKQLCTPTGGIWFWPLASGDTGIRSIQSYTLSLTATSTQMCATIIRPLAMVPMLTANGYVERDLVLQLAKLPRLFVGTALSMLLLSNTTTTPCYGEVDFAEN